MVEAGRRKLGKESTKWHSGLCSSEAQRFTLSLYIQKQEQTSAGMDTWHTELIGNVSKGDEVDPEAPSLHAREKGGVVICRALCHFSTRLLTMRAILARRALEMDRFCTS